MAKKKPPQTKQEQIRQQLKLWHVQAEKWYRKTYRETETWLQEQHKYWQQRLFPTTWEDGAFMDDVRQATLRGAAPLSNILFWVCSSFIFILLFVASIAKIDEVTHGTGKIIPSKKVQILQSLDGGIVAEILVEEGEIVAQNQPLVRIDSTGFASSYAEKQTRIAFLRAEIERLDAHINNTEPFFPTDLQVQVPELIKEQRQLFTSYDQELKQSKEVFEQQVNQRQQDLNEATENLQKEERAYKFISQELAMSETMEEKGVIPEMTILRLRREVNEVNGIYESAKLAVPRAQAALEEAQARLKEFEAKRFSELRAEKAEKQDELSRLSSTILAVKDKVERSIIRAPVKGTISRILVNTIGGVMQPGEDIIEIIPIEDQLLVEARIRPQDIAFLSPRQETKVKITAYDYSIYGGLDGYVASIGADTVVDENGEAYYPIRVRTKQGTLTAPNGTLLPIIPGMVADVDILTGRKTIMNYLLKPYYKVRDNALRER